MHEAATQAGPVQRPAADPVSELVARARAAMASFAREIETGGQARIDEGVTALA